MGRALAAMVLLASGAARAADVNTVARATLFAASEVSLAVDCLQTLDLRRHPYQHETNPLLGRAPSRGAVLGYFGGIMLSQAALYAFGPPWLSTVTSTVIVVVEVPVIYSNVRFGLKLSF
jgi:hypothetical protein